MNQEYCLWAEKRLLIAEKDSSIQGYSDGVFWERNSLLDQKKKERVERGVVFYVAVLWDKCGE